MHPALPRPLLAGLAAFALLLACGCTTLPSARDGQRCELYFGLSIPGGGEVSAADWQAFVDAEVTPRFPQGLTVIQAQGQWRQADGTIAREASRVLVLLLGAADAEASARIDALRARYRERFRQESVGRACTPAQLAF